MMDDTRLEKEALRKLLETIQDKISSFGSEKPEEEYEEEEESIRGSKPESLETEEDEEEESPGTQLDEALEGEEEHEGNPFKDFLEGKSDKPKFMPKGKLAGVSASIEIKKPMGKGRKY